MHETLAFPSLASAKKILFRSPNVMDGRLSQNAQFGPNRGSNWVSKITTRGSICGILTCQSVQSGQIIAPKQAKKLAGGRGPFREARLWDSDRPKRPKGGENGHGINYHRKPLPMVEAHRAVRFRQRIQELPKRRSKKPKRTRLKVAILKVALLKVALLKVALLKVALLKVALLKVALLKVALLKVALLNVALLNVAL